MPRTLAAALALLAAGIVSEAHAQNSPSHASFPILSESEAAKLPVRGSPLSTLSPNARASLPDTAAPPAPPASTPPATTPSSGTGPRPAAPQWSYVPLHGASPSFAESRRPNDNAELDRVRPAPHDWRKDWMLSIEGVTHAPVDAGFQAGLETPVGLRLFAGYGWMPGAYLGVWSGVASLASSDPRAQTLVQQGLDSGTSWRVAVGLRPFKSFGLYLDVGYSELAFKGSVDASALSSAAGLGSAPGSYSVRSNLHMWLAELGYQAMIADRVVLGVGLGAMGTLSAHTSVSAEGGAYDDPAIAQASSNVDSALKSYGVIPTLTLRLGFDTI